MIAKTNLLAADRGTPHAENPVSPVEDPILLHRQVEEEIPDDVEVVRFDLLGQPMDVRRAMPPLSQGE